MFNWFKRSAAPDVEKRSAASGFTAEIIQAREAYISGRRGIAELTATAQSCVSLWENGLTIADICGTDMLDPRTLALLGRSLAVRGEAVFLIRNDGLVPCSDWDLRTRHGRPTAYRISIPEAGGGTNQTALAAEVLHVRIGCDPAAPYYGSAPLKRCRLTAGLLQHVEEALSEVFECAPIGSQIVPFPESPDTDMTAIGRSFRGQRGRVLLRESVQVSAAGGPAPASDWKPADVSPDLSKAMTAETLAAARDAICGAFGVLPGLFNSATTGPLVRECQRHLAAWTLKPIAALIGQEASEKLGGTVTVDPLRPLHAFDAGGKARAMLAVAQAMAAAKAGDINPADLAAAMTMVDWGDA
jgi:hypothetical protein